jgi:hypothetical protein
MTWYIVVHDKGQAISNTEKHMFSEKLHTISQDLTHVCKSQSKLAVCFYNDIISQSSITFTAIPAYPCLP